MQLLCLVPMTQSGDELGYLPLLDFVVTDAGVGDGMATPSMLRSQLEVLQELIYITLASEGLQPVEDELGLRLTISETLAFAEEGGPIELRLVVCPAATTSAQQAERSNTAEGYVEVPRFDWDKFFGPTGS